MGKKVYFYIQVLSIDVVLGACASNLFLAKLVGVNLGVLDVLSLAFAVWIIYTFDHLLDARAIPHSAHTDRHAFHQRNFRFLSVCIALLTFIESFIVFYLPTDLIFNGLVLGGLVGGYFLMLQFFKGAIPYLKEFSIASIYILGISLSVFTYNDFHSDSFLWLFLSLFWGMAIVNLLLFSYMDSETDSKDTQASIVELLGKFKISILIGFLLSILLIVTLISIFFSEKITIEFMLVLVMQAMLWGVFLLRERNRQINLLRALADGVFMMPLLLVLNY
ncbi:hypothetical protein [Sediminitomix flava]|uniref:UbiA prenyltransferase family protein n=1 Tax=Sediminitomix flava TaxID=379075 RepID=A0A315ZEW3_SEDFL|nr:hypothetical protein [Sediminitomix flava]PWJ44061.1 hypothetical protein BC781_101411 [Sediminitomix flava]